MDLDFQVNLEGKIQVLCHIFSAIRQSFSFQNNPKNLDPSYEMDLDLWDCLGRVNSCYSKISQDWFSYL